MVKPMTICIYENPSFATDAGKDMYVTPDIAAPIIAKVATDHFVLRRPMKNVALSASRPARYERTSSRLKYDTMVNMTKIGGIYRLFTTQR